MDNRTLATARSAQDGGNLAGCRINRDMRQRRYACIIREGNILKADMSPRPSHLFSLGFFCHWGLGVKHLKEALPGGDGPREAIDHLRSLTYGEGELVHIQHELGQAAGGPTSQPHFP